MLIVEEHTLPFLWQSCLLVALVAGPLGIYTSSCGITPSSCTDKPGLQDCVKKTEKTTFRRVGKQLTRFGAAHTWHITSHCVLRAFADTLPHTSCDCFTTRTDSHWVKLKFFPRVSCSCWYEQWDWPQSCCWWSGPTGKSVCDPVLCLCAAVAHSWAAAAEEGEDDEKEGSVGGRLSVVK